MIMFHQIPVGECYKNCQEVSTFTTWSTEEKKDAYLKKIQFLQCIIILIDNSYLLI